MTPVGVEWKIFRDCFESVLSSYAVLRKGSLKALWQALCYGARILNEMHME